MDIIQNYYNQYYRLEMGSEKPFFGHKTFGGSLKNVPLSPPLPNRYILTDVINLPAIDQSPIIEKK